LQFLENLPVCFVQKLKTVDTEFFCFLKIFEISFDCFYWLLVSILQNFILIILRNEVISLKP